MKNKVLTLVFVPALELSFEFYIPINKKIHVIKNSIVDFIQGEFGFSIKNAGRVLMLDKETGIIFDENIYVKDSGIVTYIGNKEGYNNTIIIQQSNGYYAWYGNIKESVKLYDYVEKGSILGSASKEYYYVLLKDDKVVDISEG